MAGARLGWVRMRGVLRYLAGQLRGLEIRRLRRGSGLEGFRDRLLLRILRIPRLLLHLRNSDFSFWVFRFFVDGAETAYATVRAYDEGEGEGVPVFVGVGWVVAGGGERLPVFAVVGGDVSAVGAYRDPKFLGGVVGY